MLLDLMAIFAFCIGYAIWFYSYSLKNKKIFFFIFIFLAVFHDFIFIQMGFYLTEIVVTCIKSWQELLLLFLAVKLVIRLRFSGMRMNNKLVLSYFIIMFLTILGIAIGIRNGVSFYEIFLGWRKYLFGLTISLLLFHLKAFEEISFRFVYKVLLGITTIVVIYAFYQKSLFNEIDLENLTFSSKNFYEYAPVVLKKFWFFEKFDLQFMLGSWPNYIRDGAPRITSVFVGPIILSQFLAMFTLFSMGLIFSKSFKTINLGFEFCILILVFITMGMSHTRIGFLQILIGVFAWILLNLRIRSSIYWASVIGAILAVFLFLNTFELDGSAQGRLSQYKMIGQQFSFFGLGFGSPLTSFYDSWYISIVLLFGLSSILYLYLHFYWIRLLFNWHVRMDTANENYTTYKVVFSIVCSFVFAFAFQSSTASSVTTIAYFLLFMQLSHNERRAIS